MSGIKESDMKVLRREDELVILIRDSDTRSPQAEFHMTRDQAIVFVDQLCAVIEDIAPLAASLPPELTCH